MGRENWMPTELQGVPYELLYVDLDVDSKPEKDWQWHYDGLQEVIAHEAPAEFWVVDQWVPFGDIEPRSGSRDKVHVFMESEQAYILLADNGPTEAICVYPKTDSDGSYTPPFAADILSLFDSLKVQYLYSTSRRAGPLTSIPYVPGERLRLVECEVDDGECDENNDRGRSGGHALGH